MRAENGLSLLASATECQYQNGAKGAGHGVDLESSDGSAEELVAGMVARCEQGGESPDTLHRIRLLYCSQGVLFRTPNKYS